ncbi:MAG: solute carrier family 23 protein [Dongiaceae bacterium]
MTPPSTRAPSRDDPVPTRTLLLAGLQHSAVILGVGIAMPLLVLSKGNLDTEMTQRLLSLALIGLGLGTIFQIQRGRFVGSGYLAPTTFTAAYLPPCLIAMEQGGPSLVMGMLIFAGLFQMALAPALRWLRPYLPPEIGGLAVLMIGIILGILGVRLIADGGVGGLSFDGDSRLPWLGVITLATVVALNVWAKGNLRIYGTLLGITAGCLIAMTSGMMDLSTLFDTVIEQGVAIPIPPLLTPSFEPLLAVEFAISALTCSLRAMGDIITLQKVEDSDWVRPEMRSIRGGIFADGMGTALAGVIGGPIGMNTFSGSIGIAAATGLTARRIGYAIAGWLFLIALLPGVSSFFLALPRPILGGVLIFAAAFIIFNGVQVIMSRLLDSRHILMLGIPLILGLSRNIVPHIYDKLPPELLAISGSDLTVVIISALLLNLLFRIGVSRSATLTLPASELQYDALETWVREQGSHWGARVDVMRDVTRALLEFADARRSLMETGVPVRIDLAFDEYHVDLRLTYAGLPIRLDNAAPIREEELADIDMDQVESRLRAVLIRRWARKVTARATPDGKQALHMRFDH